VFSAAPMPAAAALYHGQKWRDQVRRFSTNPSSCLYAAAVVAAADELALNRSGNRLATRPAAGFQSAHAGGVGVLADQDKVVIT